MSDMTYGVYIGLVLVYLAWIAWDHIKTMVDATARRAAHEQYEFENRIAQWTTKKVDPVDEAVSA